MNARLRTRARRLILGISFVGAFATAALYPASAQAQTSQVSCFQNYAACIDRASQLAGWWNRSAAGADCYVNLLGCIRRAVIGL